jgi:PAS domain S-box-containing protein
MRSSPSPVSNTDTKKAGAGTRYVIAQLALLILAAGVYLALFFALHPYLNEGVIALAVLPVALAGWLFGPRAGLLFGFLAAAANALMLSMLGALDLPPLLITNGLPTLLILLLIGYLFGKVHSLHSRARTESSERERIEQNRKNTASLLQATLESTAAGILAIDLNGKVTTFNQKFAEMWLIQREAVTGVNLQQVQQFLSTRVRDPMFLNTRLQAVQRHPDQKQQFNINLLDGRIFSSHAMPLRADLETTGAVLSFQDITDLKQKQDALFESEQKVRSLIDHSSEGISLADEKGLVIEWNLALEKITGLPRRVAMGQPIWDILYFLLPPEHRSPNTAADLQRMITNIRLNGNSATSQIYREEIIQRRDGKRLITEMVFFPIHTEKGCMIGNFCRDISQRKAAEEAQRERQEMVETILNASPDMAALVNFDGSILAVNEPLARFLKVHRERLLGLDLLAMLSEESARANRYGMQQVLETHEPYTQEVQSEGCYYLNTIYPIYEKEGKLSRYAIFSRDVTESKQRERELEAVASIASALRAAVTRSEVYAIILDQVETLLKADGIALALRDAPTGQVRVEQARGVWTSMTNMTLSADEATRGPMLVMDQPYLNNNIQEASHLLQTRPFTGLKSTASIPLGVEGSIIGSLWIGRTSSISREDVRILSALGNITANAIHRTSLYEQTQKYVDQMSQASQIGQILAATLTLDEIYSKLGEHLYRMFPDTSTMLVLRFDPQKEVITCVYGIQDGMTLDLAKLPVLPLLPPGEGTQSQVVHTRLPLIKNDLDLFAGQRHTSLLTGSRRSTTQSAIYVPMVVRDEVLGLLQVQSYHNNRYTNADAELMGLIARMTAIAIHNAILFENLKHTNEDLVLAYETTMEGWSQALDLRDHGTAGHTERVVDLTVQLGARMGMNAEELVRLRRGAQLHDIGKMGVPDSILLKPGPLDEDEWKQMRMHPLYAYQMLNPVPEFRKILEIPYYHHERWNGSGYPHKLTGENIPLGARIFAVVDVWDALCSDRPYRNAWTQERVIEYLRDQSGYLFDPDIVNKFLDMVSE